MIKGSGVKQWCSEVCSRPLELIIGLSVLSAIAAGGAVAHVASTSFAVLFIASLVYLRSFPSSWHQLTREEHLLLIGFALYFFSAVISFFNVNDEQEYVKHLGKYANFLFIIPIYLLLSRAKLNLLPYLIAGTIISGAVYLGTALLSVAENSIVPAKGAYHHITFGDMAMLNALFMLTLLVTIDAGKVVKSSVVVKIILSVSILCLLYASVLSQARGAWLALPACLFLLLSLAAWYGKIKTRTILIALTLLAAVIVVTPAKDIVSSRIQSVTHEIELFQSGVDISSSIGDRFAMWHIAVNVWKEQPIIGSGPGDFEGELLSSQERGMYVAVLPHSSVHNIFLQALATTGTIGFVILCLALFILPFRLFYKASAGGIDVVSLSGMVVLVAFAVFGLTESWILRSPPSMIFLLYFVTLATTASQKTGVSA
ncbi:MAG: O-antigen ligase family protein [Gammaproteobacteria bacterium]|nr:O-antigen ligase family protein [Gammaproteobacteria bacterium]